VEVAGPAPSRASPGSGGDGPRCKCPRGGHPPQRGPPQQASPPGGAPPSGDGPLGGEVTSRQGDPLGGASLLGGVSPPVGCPPP
jgi:hypothetical protein